MAYPTIVFNNSTGSDTAASGAGPATALTGTSASFTGSVVTLDGSPDLTNVATDGSHVLYLVTSTGRKFFTINAKDNGADTVTLDDAPAGTASGLSWAIGGKRSTLHNTDSKLIITADGKKGWTLEVQYTGTDYQSNGSAGNLTFASAWAGDADEQGLLFIGTGSQRPLIKLYPPTPGYAYQFVDWAVVQNLKFQVENPGDVYGGGLYGAPGLLLDTCDIHFNYSATQGTALIGAGAGIQVLRCRFTGTHNNTITVSNSHPVSLLVRDCYFTGCTGSAIAQDSYYSYSTTIECSTFNDCYRSGYFTLSSGVAGFRYFRDNTFYNSPLVFGDDESCMNATILGNIFSHTDGTNASGYAIVRPSTYTQTNMIEDYNRFYQNTSGNIDNGAIGANSTTGTDPGYTNAGSGDFSIGTALKGQGAYGGVSFETYTSYPDPGAVQRQEPAGGSSVIVRKHKYVG